MKMKDLAFHVYNVGSPEILQKSLNGYAKAHPEEDFVDLRLAKGGTPYLSCILITHKADNGA